MKSPAAKAASNKPIEVKAEVKLLNEYTLLSASEIAKKCNISKALVYRIVTGAKRVKRKKSTGRRESFQREMKDK